MSACWNVLGGVKCVILVSMGGCDAETRIYVAWRMNFKFLESN